MGCTQPPPSPTCRIAKVSIADYAGPAGCLIRVQDTLLIIKNNSTGQYDVPFGEPISKESAQCTAHRNTWLQTGFNVEVDQLLGVTQSGIKLFSCTLSAGFTSEDGPIKPPNWADNDVQQIEFISPFDTRYDAWSQPDNHIMYRDGFVLMKGERRRIIDSQSR